MSHILSKLLTGDNCRAFTTMNLCKRISFEPQCVGQPVECPFRKCNSLASGSDWSAAHNISVRFSCINFVTSPHASMKKGDIISTFDFIHYFNTVQANNPLLATHLTLSNEALTMNRAHRNASQLQDMCRPQPEAVDHRKLIRASSGRFSPPFLSFQDTWSKC